MSVAVGLILVITCVNVGGLLIAKSGNGYFVYTGYSWFRQLPAGVPGAYRLFANLVSLRNAKE